MTRIPGPLLLAVLLLAGAGCGGSPSAEQLGDWLTGSFGSGAQAAADSAYYDIRLEMVPIWTDREDGLWFYVEQAVATARERPYRQRVYRVRELEDGRFESAVFTLPDPQRYAGAWREEAPLSDLEPADLAEREGCAVLLAWDPAGRYAGSTEGTGCTSTLRGAAYATSEVIVEPGRIESWDRGFDAEGNQVWGAEKGAYVFLRDDADSEASEH